MSAAGPSQGANCTPPGGSEQRSCVSEGVVIPAADPAAFEFRFAVAGAHAALAGHFPGRPIVPGVLMLHHVLSGVNAELRRSVQSLQHVKFVAVLLPDEVATVACKAIADEVTFAVRTQRLQAWVTLARGSVRMARGSPAPCTAALDEGHSR